MAILSWAAKNSLRGTVCDFDIYLYLFYIFMGPIYKTTFRGFFSERGLVDFFTYALAPFLSNITSNMETYTISHLSEQEMYRFLLCKYVKV